MRCLCEGCKLPTQKTHRLKRKAIKPLQWPDRSANTPSSASRGLCDWPFVFDSTSTLAHFSSTCKMLIIDILQKEGGGPVMWIFRTWITTKSGERIYAKDYGLRAFRIWVEK